MGALAGSAQLVPQRWDAGETAVVLHDCPCLSGQAHQAVPNQQCYASLRQNAKPFACIPKTSHAVLALRARWPE